MLGETALFPAIVAPNNIVIVNSSFLVDSVAFTGPTSYTLIPNVGGNNLTLNGLVVNSGSHMINVPLIIVATPLTIQINPSGSIACNQPISELAPGSNIALSNVGPNVGGSTIFSAVNTYTGNTLIQEGSLFLSLNGSIAASSGVTFSTGSGSQSLFDISGISGPSTTIQTLAASGIGTNTLNLGNKNLTFGTSASSSFLGTITGGIGSSLSKTGTGTFTLNGPASTYLGPTNILQGTFAAGATAVFSPNSDFILGGSATLDIGGFNNTIQSLSSSSNLTTVTNSGSNSILTISNGGDFAGQLTGNSLTISLNGGTLILSNSSNAYRGTVVNSGATVAIGNNNVLGAGNLNLISGTLQALGNFSLGNGITLSGSSTINLQSYTMTLSGSIANTGNLTINSSPQGTLILSGTNTYSGSTTLTNGVTLLAGSTGAFSPNADFTLLGTSTLDLNGFSNEIASLAAPIPPPGKALVTNSGMAAATLTIDDGGTFGGRIVDGLGATTAITLNDGTFLLASQNTYSGATTVNNGAILKADISNAFSPNSSVTLNNTATLDLNGNNNTIAGLASSSMTTTASLTNANLTINGGLIETFAGQLTNASLSCGSLTIDGGSQITLTNTANDYCGTTTIVNGLVSASATGALSPNSPIIVQSLGTLEQTSGATNSPPSLTTNGTINQVTGVLLLNTFTMTGGTVSNAPGLVLANNSTISGGTFVNTANSALAGFGSNPSLSITGGVIANGTTCTTISCTTTSPACGTGTSRIGDPNTAISFTGGLINSNNLIQALSYTQGSAATLNLILCNSTFGNLQANGSMSLNGTLVVSAAPPFSALPASFLPLIVNTAPVNTPTYTGQFSAIQLQGFSPSANPRVIISPPRAGDGVTPIRVVTLYFSGCDATWAVPSNGNWNDNVNWNPPCVPGITDPLETPIVTNDIARFANVAAPSITVTLAFENQLAPLQLEPASPVLYTLQFNASNTSYTINPFSTSQITFDAVSLLMPPAQLLVDAGSHTINAPIVLNITTDISLADGVQLTYGKGATLQAGANLSSDLFVMQSLSSTLGTGLLINNGTMSPTSFRLGSGTVLNSITGIISPTGVFSMQPTGGQNAHLINSGNVKPSGSLLFSGGGTMLVDNSGVGATIGSSQPNSMLTLGGPGAILINNSGTAAIFGCSGSNGDFLITSAGSVVLNNTGSTAMMGPSGTGGRFIVNGTGPISLNNTGKAARMVAKGPGGSFILNSPTVTVLNQGRDTILGAMGLGGNFTMSGGTLQNSLGAIVMAGNGGLFTLSGGTITNDVTSQIGTLNQNILVTGGTLTSSGAILAFDYTQGPAATLGLNVTSVDVFGFIQAAGVVNLDGALAVTALPGFTAKNSDVIVLIEGEQRLGMFSTVNLLGFSGPLTPSVHYFPSTVELLFGSTVPPSTGGSTGGTATTTALGSITEFNFLLSREMMNMHQLAYLRKKREHRVDVDLCSADENGSFVASSDLVQRKQEQLGEKREDRRCRIYIGPLASIGDLRGQSHQPGFNQTSVGMFAGIDRMGSDVGAGVAIDYQTSSASIHDHLGHFTVDQLHASAYGTWVLDWRPEISLGAIIGGGVHWYDFHRRTGPSKAPMIAKSDPIGREFDLLASFEYIFSHEKYQRMPESIEFVPLAYIQYIRSSIDSFKEKDAGTFNLRVGSQARTSLRSFLGARLLQTVSSSTVTLRTEFDLGWQREYFDEDYDLRVRPLYLPPSHSSEIQVFGLDRNSFLGGIDLLLTAYDKFQVEGSYDFQWNPKWVNHSFYFGVGGKF
jgi:autotransporter-associated beta strand protein